MMLVFQEIPFLTSDVAFQEWQNIGLGLYGKGKTTYWMSNSPRCRRNRRIGLPNLKLYFAACCLVWVKDWELLRHKIILELVVHDLRFGCHGYLCYDKVRINLISKTTMLEMPYWEYGRDANPDSVRKHFDGSWHKKHFTEEK